MSSTSRRTSVDGWSVPRGRSFGGPSRRAGSVTSTRSVASLSSSSARASSASLAESADSTVSRTALSVMPRLAVAHVAQRELEGAAAADVADAHLGERGE